MTHKDEILQYCKDITSGKQIAGVYCKKAIKRFLRDLKDSELEANPYFMDWDEVNQVIDFAEALKIPDIAEGDGKLKLFPFQKWIYANVWGWKFKDNPKRRKVRTAFVEIARKNSKTTSLLFPFILYDFLTTNAAESYFVSADLQQSDKSFAELKGIINETPELKNLIKCYSGAAVYNNSRISFFSSDTKALDGYKPSIAVIDEFWNYQQGGDKVVTSMRFGQRARLNGTTVIITSAGVDTNSPCYNEVIKSRNILDGTLTDDSYFCVLYEVDKDDDWTSPDILMKANPALGTFLKKEVLISDLNDALLTPSHQIEYKAKTLGLWNTQGVSNWISPDDLQNETIDLTGEVCFAGLDLSAVSDLTCYTLCFHKDDRFYLNHRIYIPLEQLKIKAERSTVNFQEWVDKGIVKIAGDKTIDYDVLIADFCNDAQVYKIKECAFDRWGSREVINKLNDQLPNILFLDYDQSLKNFSQPTKNYEKLVLEHKINDSNPVARWALSNCVIRPDPNNNYKPLKQHNASEAKIDPIICSIMALDRCYSDTQNQVKQVDFSTILNSF